MSEMASIYNQINNYLMSLGVRLPRKLSMLFNGSLPPDQIYNQLIRYLRMHVGMAHPNILNNIYQILNSVVSYQAYLPQQRVAQTVLYSNNNNNYRTCRDNLSHNKRYVCNIFKDTNTVDGDYYNYFYNN